MRAVVVHCTLFDGVARELMNDAWVSVVGGKIEAVGLHAGMGPPEGEVLLDARGGCVLPGMINLHVHIQRRHLRKRDPRTGFRGAASAVENEPDGIRMVWALKNAWDEIRHGVTTIRDCGSKNRINNQLREAISTGQVRGPRVVACGFPIAATGGHETHRYQGAVEVDGPDAVRRAVRTEIKAGADFIKFMAGGGLGGMPEHEDPRWAELSVDELKAGVEEAHNRGRRTSAHAMGAAPVRNALAAGVDCIEHGGRIDREALEMMAEKGVFYVPTISGMVQFCRREAERGNKELACLIDELVVSPAKRSIEEAFRLGVRIGAGTDTLGDLVDELLLLRSCGIPAEECLAACTRTAAEILGLEQVIGTVEPGKVADLVVVDGNPLRDLGDLRRVRAVIKGGELLDPRWLMGEATEGARGTYD